MFEALVAGTIAVLATAVAWAVAYRVGPAGTRRHRAVLLATSVVIFTVANATLMPHARAWKQEREVDTLLREDPVFAAALADDPSLRAPLRGAVLGGLRGGGPDEAVAAGLRLLSPRLWRSVAGASDAAALRLGRALVATLTDLQTRDPQQCYRFLFPAAGLPAGGGAPRDEGLLRALGAAALSAHGGGAAPLDRPSAAKQLEKAYGRLRGRHGADVDVLRNALAPGVDRARVCAMTVALYAELVALPPDAAGQVLRHVLGPAPPAAVPPPPAPDGAASPPPAS